MSPTRLAAASLAAFLIISPALAQAQVACGAPPPQAQPRKPSALGGLLAAAREAGLGEAIAGGMGGSGRNSTAAAVVGAALSGDPSSAAAALPYDSRHAATARVAGALTGAALNLARSAGSTNAACEAQGGPQPPSDGDVWK
ncbi:hypothetical protein GGQ61_001355 [Phenylobacterium haematophilum]|uniref:Uncharacterized protein n=1 Tax=Phenylobacterium haematophilum TaxID=98513 RepID=A0A839ZX44_9CAUL|nr:hypothetical protein [Phenylobacterium haematophilum]MBB3890638.1 hypothetical protein [Phenylobacterium haematophilum]